mgnify:CR=1 FL=1
MVIKRCENPVDIRTAHITFSENRNLFHDFFRNKEILSFNNLFYDQHEPVGLFAG